MKRKSGVSNVEKWNIRLMMTLTIFTFIGLLIDFIPAPSYAYYAQIVVCIGVTVCVIPVYVEIRRTKVRKKRRVQRKNKHAVVTTRFTLQEIFVPPIAVFFMLYFSLIYGLPSVIHFVIAEDKGRMELVAYKPSNSYDFTPARCRGAITVKSPLILPQRVCNVLRTTHDTLKDGDVVTVYGRQSILGIGL
ncbi:hypothetical protein NM22_01070 [Vibrio tubiashii]|nr:hypothetical protein NM22_01070 [Vibrio tubiashii]